MSEHNGMSMVMTSINNIVDYIYILTRTTTGMCTVIIKIQIDLLVITWIL